MLRSNTAFIRRFVVTVDLILIAVAFVAAYVLRLYDEAFALDKSRLYFLIFCAGLPLWHLLLRYNGGYESIRQKSAWIIVKNITKIAVVFSVLQFAVLFLFKIPEVARGVMISSPLLAALFLISFRLFGLTILGGLRQGGFNYRHVLIVGTDAAAMEYVKRIRTNLNWGLRVSGFLSCEEQPAFSQPLGYPVLGSVHELATLLLEKPIDRVVFSLPLHMLDQLPNYLAVCEELGIESVFIPPVFSKLQVTRIHVDDFFGLPVINYTTTPRQMGQLAIKQIMDFTLTFLALLLLLPLFLVLALAVKLTSPGPIFFAQHRAGIRGRRFNCYKFRSMYVDSEARLQELSPHNEMSGPVFKMTNDPRITPVGRILRKFSLDELPQLFNVMRGDMSLVGPRPPLPAEVACYEPWQRRRLSMKPGITCIWQVSGRNNIDFEQWMRLDLEYIDNWNLSLDFKLLLKTIPAVLKGSGV